MILDLRGCWLHPQFDLCPLLAPLLRRRSLCWWFDQIKCWVRSLLLVFSPSRLPFLAGRWMARRGPGCTVKGAAISLKGDWSLFHCGGSSFLQGFLPLLDDGRGVVTRGGG